jgi:SAM-dependent methyltransferase
LNPLQKLVAKIVSSLETGTFVRLVLSGPAGKEMPQKILGRAVLLRGLPHLSLTLRHPTQDITKNIPLAKVGDWLTKEAEKNFRNVLVCTTTRDWQLISGANGSRLVDHKPANKTPPATGHDDKTDGFLGCGAADWLQGLDVTDHEGRIRASMADKYRQINRYLEIFSHLTTECGWNKNTDSQSQELQIADMGCGKGYLTFGLWHLFHRELKHAIRVTGVESRADLVKKTNRLAAEIHAAGLEFIEGEIATATLPRLDALIALHACNTATDDAIARGIALGAKLIVVAPCCHKEMRAQIGKPKPLASILRHGIMEERMAEWATDGLRAMFLEWAGYKTKIMEFIGGEHTPKNLMIAAIRERKPFTDAPAREKIIELKNFFGVKRHALDPLLSTNTNFTK